MIQMKKHTTTYLFQDTIHRVWNILKDLKISDEILKDYRTPIEIVKGNNTYEVGNECKLLWGGLSELNLICTEVIDTYHYKKINWRVHATNPELIYDYCYNLHLNTIDKTTLLVWDVIYVETVSMPKKLRDSYDYVRKELLKRFDAYLKKNIDDLYQCESIIINAEREKIWNIITNWKKFQKIVPILADEISYEGDPLQINTHLILKWINKKMTCSLKVLEVNKKNLIDEWDYVLECFDGNPKVPLQELHFKLIDLTNKSTFVQFQHTFKETLKYDLIESVGKDKKHILSSLKNYFEKKQNK